MIRKIAKIPAAIIGFLVITNLVSVALLWHDHREKYPSQSKPTGHLKIVVERIPNSAATPEYNFTSIPCPTNQSAASFAQFSVVAGFPAGAGLDKLQAPFLPSGPDSPNESFFFSDGTYGGRFMLDFQHAIEIRQINSYSWHTGARGPQLYKLYALDGATEPQPVGMKDPETLGWKYLGEVDTRPKSGEPGGQYGVSISGADGVIGHYRYLLFDCKRTEEADRWGNTFYSKLDVIGQ
jgi:hypothetical protein